MSHKRTDEEARGILLDIVDKLGIGYADTIFVGIDMGKVPLPYVPVLLSREAVEQRNRALCEFVFDTLRSVIGDEGTIVVPTYTYSCGQSASVYIHEQTPSEVGPFTEYVRCLPGSKRSVHPLFSVCATGRRAAEITEGCGGAAFGAYSPFSRLSPCEAKFLCLGVPFRQAVTYIHHLEQCYGCNHRYNKVLRTKVMVGGVEVQDRFLAYLRFRGMKADVNFAKMEHLLLAEGVLRQVALDGAVFQAVSVADVDAFGYRALKQKPTFFLSQDVVIYLEDHLVCDLALETPEISFNLDVMSP